MTCHLFWPVAEHIGLFWKCDPKNSWQCRFPKQDSSLGREWHSEGCRQFRVQHHSWATEINSRLVLWAFTGDFVAFFPTLIFQLNICRCHGNALAALSLLQLEPRRSYCLQEITTTKHSASGAVSMGCTSSGSNMEIETVFLPSLNPFNSSESFIEIYEVRSWKLHKVVKWDRYVYSELKSQVVRPQVIQAKREHDDANNDAILEGGNGEQSFFGQEGALWAFHF